MISAVLMFCTREEFRAGVRLRHSPMMMESAFPAMNMEVVREFRWKGRVAGKGGGWGECGGGGGGG